MLIFTRFYNLLICFIFRPLRLLSRHSFNLAAAMARTSSSPVGTLLLTIANVLIPVSIIVFAIGFFPYKPFLPGLAEYETLEYGSPPDAPFDKLVFMVVDALRR